MKIENDLVKPGANQTHEDIYRIVFDYTAKIANEKRLSELLIMLRDMAKELIDSDRATIWMWDKPTKTLWTKVAHGVDELRIPDSSGLVGYSINTGEDIFINDAQNDSRFNKEVDKKTGYVTKSILVVPFENNDGEIIGAIQVLNKQTTSGLFSDIDIKHLKIVATYAGKSVETAFLNQEIEDTQKEVVFLMGEIGESRSKETGNHVKRVAEYSKVLALGIGMSEDESELLRIASPMHDIGKVAIEDAILKKPGKLEPEEFAVMQSHTEIGYSILKNSNRRIIKAAAIVAHQHHEKWNGRGYPQGLKGEEIHIFGRITAVADVFDALGSDRCYKKAWDLERILKMFEEEKGQHFCPTVMDAFMNNLEEILKIRDKYQDICES